MQCQPRSLKVTWLVIAICLTSGCAGGAASGHGRGPTAGPSHGPPPSQTVEAGSPASGRASRHTKVPTKILLFVLENHAESQALTSMPYLSSLAARYGKTTDYHAITHPSLPNYLALAAGSTFGVHDDNEPSAHPLAGRSVFDQALARGRTAKLYAESMPGNCYLASTASYAVKHNPWAYFAGSTERANCRRYDLPMGTPAAGALANDIAAGALPQVGMAIPNICNDGHDCSLATADNWLHQWLPTVFAGSDYHSGRLAVVVTFDEDDGGATNTVLTVVISPRTIHVTATTPYTHYSWLRCADQILRLPPVRNAAAAPSLCSAFML